VCIAPPGKEGAVVITAVAEPARAEVEGSGERVPVASVLLDRALRGIQDFARGRGD